MADNCSLTAAEIEGLVVLVCNIVDAQEKMSKALQQLACLPLGYWYEKSFERPKKSGGQRIITPATRPLYTAQHYISKWLYESFLRCETLDYCYNGASVRGAIHQHTGPYGVLLDIKDAYNQISRKRLERWFKLRTAIPHSLVPALLDLLTFNGITPQGCCSTPYCYNLIMLEVDWLLKLWLQQELPQAVITRYVDNFLISSIQPLMLDQVRRQATRVLVGSGFSISWNKIFDESTGPILYLGAAIYPDRVELDPEKTDTWFDAIIQATQSQNPLVYYKRITGMFAWANQICQPHLPPQLFEEFKRYYTTVGQWPQSLSNVVLTSS